MRKKEPTITLSRKKLEALLDARFEKLTTDIVEQIARVVRLDRQELEHLRVTEKTLRQLNKSLMSTRSLAHVRPKRDELADKLEKMQAAAGLRNAS